MMAEPEIFKFRASRRKPLSLARVWDEAGLSVDDDVVLMATGYGEITMVVKRWVSDHQNATPANGASGDE